MTTSHETLFIGGGWAPPSSAATIEVRNASTGEHVAAVPEGAEGDIDAAVAAARRAFDDPAGWSSWPPSERAAALERLAAELERRTEEIGRLVSIQNGMPIALSPIIEGLTPVGTLRYVVSLLASAPVEEETSRFLGGDLVIRHEPIGVVNIVPGGREVGAYLVQHPDVDKVAFTGSTAAGRQIAEVCGRLLRPVSLELGGKSAAIILADLDLAAIGQNLFSATLVNNGQTCYAGTRILAPRSRYAEVVDTFAAFASSLPVGDALDPATLIGPLVAERQRDRVERYIAK